MPNRIPHTALAALLIAGAACAADIDISPSRDITFVSSKDGSSQPTLFYVPPAAELGTKGAPAPLVVLLHSWSATYKAAETTRQALLDAVARGWVFLAPDFRGPNQRPEACASDLAVQDILDAVAYARKHARVDSKRIYLLGGSGGGHMTLMMASRAPQLWAAASAWVPIADLSEWHASTKAAGLRYCEMLEKCCGGPPEAPGAAAEYRKRSPLTWLSRSGKLPIDINVGIHDGHNKLSVPVRQSLLAFNRLAETRGFRAAMIEESDIATITKDERIPGHLKSESTGDMAAEKRAKPVLFRRSAGKARLSIFDGGHDSDFAAGMAWLATQSK